jgi:hypothetical protein
MFKALQLTEDLLDQSQYHTIRVFLDPRYGQPIEVKTFPVEPRAKRDDMVPRRAGNVQHFCFRYAGINWQVPLDNWLVKDRKTARLEALYPADFAKLYYEYEDPAIAKAMVKDLTKLSDFIFELTGVRYTNASAVPAAIELLKGGPLYRLLQPIPKPGVADYPSGTVGQSGPELVTLADGKIVSTDFNKDPKTLYTTGGRMFNPKGGWINEAGPIPAGAYDNLIPHSMDGIKARFLPLNAWECPSCKALINLSHPCACSAEAIHEALWKKTHEKTESGPLPGGGTWEKKTRVIPGGIESELAMSFDIMATPRTEEPVTTLNPEEELVHLCDHCRQELEPGHVCRNQL